MEAKHLIPYVTSAILFWALIVCSCAHQKKTYRYDGMCSCVRQKEKYNKYVTCVYLNIYAGLLSMFVCRKMRCAAAVECVRVSKGEVQIRCVYVHDY